MPRLRFLLSKLMSVSRRGLLLQSGSGRRCLQDFQSLHTSVPLTSSNGSKEITYYAIFTVGILLGDIERDRKDENIRMSLCKISTPGL